MFAVDGRWGSGKTTFARMLSCVLKQDAFRVVNINAWDADYTDDPLGALTHALHDAMGSASKWRKQIKKTGIALMQEVVVGTVRFASGGLVGGEALKDLAESASTLSRNTPRRWVIFRACFAILPQTAKDPWW